MVIETGVHEALAAEKVYVNPQANEQDTQVSVLVCCNAASALQRCLSSIRVQTERRLEIICLYDDANEDVRLILEQNAAEDQRVRSIAQTHLSYGSALNRGLEAASGEWVTVVKPGDWIEMGMYFSMLVFFYGVPEESCGRIDIVKTPYWRIFDPTDSRIRKLNCAYRGAVRPPTQPFSIADGAELLAHRPSIYSALYRRAFLLEQRLRFPEAGECDEADDLFAAKTLIRAHHILYLDQPFYCHSEQSQAGRQESLREDPLVLFKRWERVLDILEQGGMSDPRLLSAHYLRAFSLIDELTDARLLRGDQVTEAVQALFERMDAELVASIPCLSPIQRRLFAHLRGLPEENFDQDSYRRHLLKEGLRSLRNDGPAHAAALFRQFLGRKA
jgi:hypothetical protein